MARGSRGRSGGRARSTVSGRFVRRSTARRSPNRTVVHASFSQGGKQIVVARSAKTGRFISKAAAARHPDTSLLQTVRR
jgi:hypothetical protein